MTQRFNYQTVAPGAYKAMSGLEAYLKTCGLEAHLVHLIKLRASQINGCAYCLDMHSKDLAAAGESLQRMVSLDAWRDLTLAIATINAWNRLTIAARTEPGRYKPAASA